MSPHPTRVPIRPFLQAVEGQSASVDAEGWKLLKGRLQTGLMKRELFSAVLWDWEHNPGELDDDMELLPPPGRGRGTAIERHVDRALDQLNALRAARGLGQLSYAKPPRPPVCTYVHPVHQDIHLIRLEHDGEPWVKTSGGLRFEVGLCAVVVKPLYRVGYDPGRLM